MSRVERKRGSSIGPVLLFCFVFGVSVLSAHSFREERIDRNVSGELCLIFKCVW